MPRVYKKIARKDYPQFGVAKGDIYYEWAFYRSRPVKSPTPPTRSQLTQREELQLIYNAYDSVPSEPTHEDVESMADAVGEAADILEGKHESVPENLQQSEQACALEESADACRAAADELCEIASAMEEVENSSEDTTRDWLAEIADTEPEVS